MAVPFSSLSLLCPKSKKPFKRRDFSFGAEKGIRPVALGQCHRQPGELKTHSPDGFFASPCSAVPFSSLSLLCPKSKNPFKRRDFSFGAEKGIRTLVTVPRKHDFQSCALDQLSHLCKPLDYNTPFCVALQAKFALAPPKALSLDNPARARQNYARIICGG